MTRKAGYKIDACPKCGQAHLFAVYGSTNMTCHVPRDAGELILGWTKDELPAMDETPVIPAFLLKDPTRIGVRAVPSASRLGRIAIHRYRELPNRMIALLRRG